MKHHLPPISGAIIPRQLDPRKQTNQDQTGLQRHGHPQTADIARRLALEVHGTPEQAADGAAGDVEDGSHRHFGRAHHVVLAEDQDRRVVGLACGDGETGSCVAGAGGEGDLRDH